MPHVLIAGGPLRHWPGTFRTILESAGFALVEPEGNHGLTEPELLAHLPDCEAILAGGEALPGRVIAACPKLRVIARVGVGYDSVDLPEATARKIPVTITPGTNQESVAEQAFALLLGVARRVALNDRLIRRGGWDRAVVTSLRGKTLGLVGLGRIGRAMVPRARAFGMTVIVCDPILDPDYDARSGGRRVGLAELLAESDVVSLHAPLVESTYRLIRGETLAAMKPGAILINTARGGLVDEADLVEALRSGRLAGAGLDVTDPEPPRPDNPLFALDNVVISPHIAGVDEQSLADMAAMAARSVVELYEGRWPEGCVVNPEIAPGWRW